jgi:CRISPR type IV-associated protein Csf1
MQEKAVIALPCGTVRTGQRIRCYSWVITETSAIAATKAHREWIFAQCMQPPPPPFVICLSDSGQKHLLYRAVVCHSQATVTVTLEGERIHYTPELLQNRRRICQRIAAVLGKPSLREPLTIQQQMRLVEYYQEPELLAEWLSVQSEPITRLATWLTPSREACQQ